LDAFNWQILIASTRSNTWLKSLAALYS